MKIFLVFIFLIFNIQSWTKADDIRDFEIEGISIGDSILDFYNQKEINNAVDNSYDDTKFVTRTFFLNNSDIYEFIQLTFKPTGKKIIYGINAGVIYDDNFDECHNLKKDISSGLSSIFPTAKIKNWGRYEFSKGHYFPITYDLNDSSRVMVACYKWNKEANTSDSLKVTIYSNEYQIFLSKQDQ
tara:strand:+ start:266 stop:820 length:555 start_codon:yes stop_codon:yes gene_type:complete